MNLTSPLLTSQEVKGHALMAVATLFISTTFPIGAVIARGMDPVVLTFLRFSLAALVFAPFVAVSHGLRLPKAQDALRYSVLSACLVGFFWAMFEALRHTSALNGAAIFTLIPMITAGFTALILRERIHKAARLALLAGFVGAMWVVFRGDMDALLALEVGRGDLIFFAGTVSMGLYGPLIKRLHKGEPVTVMTFWTLVFGAIWLALLAAPKLGGMAWGAVDMQVYSGIVYLAFVTIVGFYGMQSGALSIGPTKVTAYSYLNPSLVFVYGLIMGTQVWTENFVPGFLLSFTATAIFLGVKVPNLQPKDKRDIPCPNTKA